jgi:predicted nucleic acid-binding protein
LKHLLDVSVLLSAAHEKHPEHGKALAWMAGKEPVLCPSSEMGFLRISTNSRAAFGVTMADARALLEGFYRTWGAEWVADDLPALGSHPSKSDAVMDHYLADLAVKHGCKLATFDQGIRHPSAELIR